MGWCHFKAEILKKRSLMNGHDYLSVSFTSDRPKHLRQMNNVHVVHILNRIVEYQDIVPRLLDQVERQKQTQSRRIEIARTQHRTRLTEMVAFTSGFKVDLQYATN